MTQQSNLAGDDSASDLSRRSLLGGLGAATFGITAGSAEVSAGNHGDERPGRNRGRRERGSNDEKQLLPPGPGPSLLYEDAPRAPPFQNVGEWDAEPLYVMGSNAYVDGEFLYQGFIFDDYGAETGYPESQPHTGGVLYQSGGDLHYPADQSTYGHNAADLLEFRVTDVGDQIKYRLTLNTMLEPDVAGIAIGINTDQDTSTGTNDWGYGIGMLGELGLDHVLLTWGTGAELVSHTSEGIERRAIESEVDIDRNQIELTVPLDPGEKTWRHHLVTGLFDTDEMAFKQIQEQPDEENPGGAAGQDPPPVFDVGFRHHGQESWGRNKVDIAKVEDTAAAAQEGHAYDWGYWRDESQSKALAEGDISEFFADIDFGKIRRKVNEYDVPQSGFINCVYGSQFDFGEGIQEDDAVMMAGRVQPYGLYIPESFSFDEPSPLFLQLHGGSSMHNQILSTPNFIREFGEKRDALILSPLAREPSAMSYDNQGELDVFEALSHVDTHYNVDFNRLKVGGSSTGGEGSMKIAGRYPDLFNGTFCIVAGTLDEHLIDNHRHVPLLLWSGVADHRTPWWSSTHAEMLDRNYRHEQCVFPGYGHVRLNVEDEWGPAREYLDQHDVPPRFPWHVTYHANPELANPEWNLTHDGAYWLSDISVASDADTGKVDAKDRNAGQAPPEVRTYQEHRSEPDNHVASGLEWHDAVMTPRARNRIDLELEGVDGVKIWLDATEIDPTEPIELATVATHQVTVSLISHAGQTDITVPAGSNTRTVRL